MKRYLIIALAAVALLNISCRRNTKGELNRQLTEMAADRVIDHDEWLALEKDIRANRQLYRDFFKDDQLQVESVREYAEDYFERRHEDVDLVGIDENHSIGVDFYLERSGSMIYYDQPQGDGAFKAALVEMLNSLPDAGNKMFVVNDGIYPYPRGIRQFISDNNVFRSTDGIGDPSYTDFPKIFDAILNNTPKDRLSILVTDMIYSTKQMGSATADKVFSDASGMVGAVFKDKVKDQSLLIVQIHASYNGFYYSFDNSKQTYNGQRPYYIIVCGSNQNMARLTRDKAFAAFSNFVRLRNMEHEYLFTSEALYKPYYSLLLSQKDIRGRFKVARGQRNGITAIKSLKADPETGDLQLALAVDLGHLLLDEAYLTDADNYELEADSELKIKKIRRIDKAEASASERQYIGSATHLFILQLKNPKRKDEISLKLMNRLPKWVSTSSTDDDRTPQATTTFGLRQLLQGIYDSYQRQSDDKPKYFELNIKIG